MAHTVYPASEKQVAFIAKLMGEKNTDSLSAEDEAAYAVIAAGDAPVSSRGASEVITALMALPRKPKPAQSVEVMPGIYVVDGQVVKVKANKAETAVYASLWVESHASRMNEDGHEVHGEWVYTPGLIVKVKTDDRMTVDEAKAFILRYGQCARCGRKLKAAKSVEDGIGPVCIKYFSF